MKLSLALLSILQKQSAEADDLEGSTYEGPEDTIILDTCLTIYMPNAMVSGMASVEDMCNTIQTAYHNDTPSEIKADFTSTSKLKCFK